MTALPKTQSDLVPLRVVPVVSDPSRHPVRVYLAGLAPNSRRVMLHGLEVIAETVSGGRHDAETLPWATIRYQHTAAVRAYLASHYAPATANLYLAALRGTLKAAWRIGYLNADEYHRAADVARIKGDDVNDDHRAGRSLDYREARALFKVCSEDRTATGRRDAALLGLLWGCGLRRAEVVSLTLADLMLTEDAARLRVRGKGNRVRTAYLTQGALQALRDWLRVRGEHTGPLLHPVRQGGAIHRDRPMSSQAIFNRVRTLAKRAGVDGFSPHDLRRSFVSDLLDSGVDLATVKALAGHASVNTTERYDRRGGEVKLAAMQRRKTPYVEARKS